MGLNGVEKGKNTEERESYLRDTHGSSILIHTAYLLGRSTDA